MSAKDMWEGDSAQLDNFEMEIASAKFGFTEYNKGKTPLLILEGSALTVDDGKTQDHHLWFSIGDTMEPSPDGSSCKHESGDESKSFNSRSAVMDLVRAAFKCGTDAEAHLRQFSPLEAKAWVGTKWLFQVQKVGEFTPEGETEKRVITRALPVKFLGVGTGSSGTGSAASHTPTAQSAPSSTPSTPAPAAESNGELTDAALKVLKMQVTQQGGDYWKFLEMAVGRGGDPSDPRLAESTGIWAQ